MKRNRRARHRRVIRRSHSSDRWLRSAFVFETLEARTVLSGGPIPAVPTPAAHWTFDDGSGTTAADSSGNNHPATLGANVSWNAGNVGTHGIGVNGTTSAVATVTGPVVNTANSFTVSAWVKLTSASGYQTVVSIAGTSAAGFFLGMRGDTGAFSFARIPSDSTANAKIAAATSAPLAGVWYHIVGVDDVTAGTLSLYIDGQLAGTTAFAGGWTANGNTLIGHGFYNGAQTDNVNGSIDEVEFFSSALSADQVAALDQPAYYTFDEGTGTTSADYSGHGNTLTLGTGASWSTGQIGSNSLAVNGTATGNAVAAAPVLNTAQSFSVSAWVKLNSLAGTQTFVSIDGQSASAFALQYRSDTGRFAFTRLASDNSGAQAFHADATSSPTAGTWYNLVGVDNVATGQLMLYVNGVLQATVGDTTPWQATGATVIGGGETVGARSDFANAQIDDVRFFNSPLSSAAAGNIPYIGTTVNSVLNVALGSTGATVSPDLFGAFMEDINYGGEGGIYNDEIRNSGFNDSTNALNAWSVIKPTAVTATLTSDATTGPTTALTQSGKIAVTSGAGGTSNNRVGIANAGYFGLAVAPSTSYSVQFYAKASSGFTGSLTIDIESTGGTIYASATVSSITTSWALYTVTLNTTATAPTSTTNRFVISTTSSTANGRSLWFGAAYLFPPSYLGANNHLRIDLMQKLAAMQPAIFRVPGGNYLEGNNFATRFQWANTIGPVQNRPGHYNSAWGYWSTDGMGLDEYLQMAEEVGARPLLAVYAGYTLGGTSDTGTTLTNDVTDAVNELHYVLDPVTTTWGALRAANGHPAPYNVHEVEIGNEDWFSTTYPQRYPLFYNAIHAAFPQLTIIATSTATGGSPYDIVDDHFYETPQWFEANGNYFNNMPRGSTKIMIGEYASTEGSPTNDMNSALGDAAWLLGLERNSDLVTMSSYAPLWVNVNGVQWRPDLIGFNGTSSYGSPSYYAQVMLAQSHGNINVSSSTVGAPNLRTLVTKTGSTYYLTVINIGGTADPTTVNLGGAITVSSTANVTAMSAATSTATNSITSPTNIVPVTSTLSGVSSNFSYTFPAYSLTILKFDATFGTPSVATPASANPTTVSGKTTNLSVLGADPSGESNLSYTWSATGPGAVSYSANSNNSAKNTTATFTKAGTYTFTVKIADPSVGATASSSVMVTVNQVATGISVLPTSTIMATGSTAQFIAGTVDQFGNVMGTAPDVVWSVLGGPGSISASGVYSAPAAAGSATVLATFTGGATSDASVTIVAPIAWYQSDASTGTSLADSSGNAEDGMLTGNAAFAGGVSGNSLSLTGGNANLPTGIVSGLNDFTIAAWVKPNSLDSWGRIFDFGTGQTANMFLTDNAGGTNNLRFAITTAGGGAEQRLNGPSIPINAWSHVAITLSGNVATMYVNGVAVATNNSMTIHPAALGNTNLNYLGKSQYSDPAYQGSIDDFRIYNAALSAPEVFALANPAFINAAAATSNPVTTATTTLSTQGTDLTAGETALTYTWTTLGTPPAPVNFSINGTNAAKNTVVTFTQPGTYNFQVAIVNPAAGATFTATSSMTVTVNSTLTTITVSPPSANLFNSQTQQFAAMGYDQFGVQMAVQPAFDWSIDTGSVGSVDGEAMYTAPSSVVGTATVRAASAGVSGAANLTVNWQRGDLDGDGLIDLDDFDQLMVALTDENAYATQRGIQLTDVPHLADVDNDGKVTNLDMGALLFMIAHPPLNAAATPNYPLLGSDTPLAVPIPSVEATIPATAATSDSVTVVATLQAASSPPNVSDAAIAPASNSTVLISTATSLAGSTNLKPSIRATAITKFNANTDPPEAQPLKRISSLNAGQEESQLSRTIKRHSAHHSAIENHALDELFANWR